MYFKATLFASVAAVLICSVILVADHLSRVGSTAGVLTCEIRNITFDGRPSDCNVKLEGGHQMMGCKLPACRVLSMITKRTTIQRLTATSDASVRAIMEFTVSELGSKVGRLVDYDFSPNVKVSMIIRWTKCRTNDECLI